MHTCRRKVRVRTLCDAKLSWGAVLEVYYRSEALGIKCGQVPFPWPYVKDEFRF